MELNALYGGSYGAMVGSDPLYREGGNPFDAGHGCSLDGIAVGCSFAMERLNNGTAVFDTVTTVTIRRGGGGVESYSGRAGLPAGYGARFTGSAARVAASAFHLYREDGFGAAVFMSILWGRLAGGAGTDTRGGAASSFFAPQHPTVVQPSKPISDVVRDLLTKGDCADYVQKLLNKANELFAGKYPHVNTISKAMDMIDKAGGYQLDGKGYHTVSGDLFYKGGGAQPGTVHIIPFRTYDTPNAANVAYAEGYYAVAGLHETFHLARQGGYNDELMATTAFSLAGKKLPTPPANLDGYGRAAFFSSLFDDELLKHCPKG